MSDSIVGGMDTRHSIHEKHKNRRSNQQSDQQQSKITRLYVPTSRRKANSSRKKEDSIRRNGTHKASDVLGCWRPYLDRYL